MGEAIEKYPQAESCRLIDFIDYSINPGIVNDTWFLTVNGEKPYLNMAVSLVPRIYIQQPDYWGIEVVAYLNGIGLPTVAPYSQTIPLDGIRGKKGIEIIGANRKEKINI